MTRFLCAIVLGTLALPLSARAQTGDAAAGKALWAGNTTLCRQCHGANGEGGFGPDLAARGLTPAQIAKAVRQPWGIMPAFVAEQVSDRQIADLAAFFDGLPKPAQPAEWRVPLSPSMPRGQQLAVANGCAQCHGAELPVMRANLGAAGADYAWFVRLVYNHTTEIHELDRLLGDDPPTRMGNFSPLRIPEATLQEMWQYISSDLGLRARLEARVAPRAVTDGTAYTVTVLNRGLANKGPAADDVTVSLTLPSGATVVNTTGAGYQGLAKDSKGADVARWRIPRLAPTEMQTLTITVSSNAPLQAGAVTWARPAQKNGAAADNVQIQLPRAATASQ